MMSTEDIELTSLLRVEKEIKEKINTYVLFPFKRHNSIHLTMVFGRKMSLPEMHLAFNRFMAEFFALTGLKESKVSNWSYLFTRNKNGWYCPHIHMALFSTRDAKTGVSVARLPLPVKQRLADLWKAMTGESLKMKRIYDYPGLAEYIAGRNNMLRPRQRWLRLPDHNLSLVESKVLKKAA